MEFDRRTFIERSLMMAAAATTGAGSLLRGAQVTSAPARELISRMKWMNEPAAFKEAGGVLTVRSKPKTDFWPKKFYGYITDNGHSFHLPVKGDFVFQARVNGQYAALYDQAGLMVRQDAENWMKCGTEYFDGSRHASVVFTRDFSDWSTMPDLSNTAAVWWRAVRKKDSIETHCSLDGENFMTIRQGYFPPGIQVEVGIMCAAPEGPGFDAIFDNLKLEIG